MEDLQLILATMESVGSISTGSQTVFITWCLKELFVHTLIPVIVFLILVNLYKWYTDSLKKVD